MSKSSIQKELIELSEQKYREALNKPGIDQDELRFLELMVQFFNNEDAIREAPRTITTGTLVHYGVDLVQAREMYKKLMEEVNRKYILIHPDSFIGFTEMMDTKVKKPEE